MIFFVLDVDLINSKKKAIGSIAFFDFPLRQRERIYFLMPNSLMMARYLSMSVLFK